MLLGRFHFSIFNFFTFLILHHCLVGVDDDYVLLFPYTTLFLEM